MTTFLIADYSLNSPHSTLALSHSPEYATSEHYVTKTQFAKTINPACRMWSLAYHEELCWGLLLNIYINDLPDSISFSVCLFADDCVVYRQVTNPHDHLILQHDLNSVSDWCDKWLTFVNSSECKLVTFSRKRSISAYSYLLGLLLTSHSYKHLGVHLSSDLSWTNHVNLIASSAFWTSRYLRRSLYSAPPHHAS